MIGGNAKIGDLGLIKLIGKCEKHTKINSDYSAPETSTFG